MSQTWLYITFENTTVVSLDLMISIIYHFLSSYQTVSEILTFKDFVLSHSTVEVFGTKMMIVFDIEAGNGVDVCISS